MREKDNTLQLYLGHLLSSVEEKRMISIKEFCETDLNANETIENVNSWYDDIVSKIKKAPPNYYVKYLEVIENLYGQIQSVKYVYYASEERVYPTTFAKTIN